MSQMIIYTILHLYHMGMPCPVRLECAMQQPNVQQLLHVSASKFVCTGQAFADDKNVKSQHSLKCTGPPGGVVYTRAGSADYHMC